MDVKEAIEFLKSIRWNYDVNMKKLDKINEVITLLQQGEAYRQMWEDIKEYVFNDEERSLLIHTGDTKKIMKNMEKKYFPKKCKKEVKTNGSG